MITLAPKPLFTNMILAFRAWQARLPSRAKAHITPQTKAAKQGFVSFVGAGPGSADLITLRGLERLQAADMVYYDRLADPALLKRARNGARLIYVGKAPGCHAMPQAQINSLLVQSAQAGQQVVRLKCGDPGIFGRGAEEADAMNAAGVEWEIVPGVTSACAAAASARSFLTERGQTERLILATGHLRHDGAQDWTTTAQAGTTLACYMAVSQAASMTQGLLGAGWPAESAVQVISKAQTREERVFHCRLDGLEALCAQYPNLNPAILLIRWTLSDATSGALRVNTVAVSA
ncbi:uroporphyrinogen-III C-methyltransferase [Cypionkella sp. TWP1-2-1b2]|uniref:uroporphyrinogen-III C-methyltransferase n=1 Tax=Cypionkella sp. TWP1-2-1b2 TaxID=2804675 RepID=UPI003CFBA6C4